MSRQRTDIERAVIASVSSASSNRAIHVRADTEVLQVLDSLGFFTAIVDLQEMLQISLGPQEILQLFNCYCIADVTDALLKLTSAVPDSVAAEVLK